MLRKSRTVFSITLAVLIFIACTSSRKAALPDAGLPIVEEQISRAEKFKIETTVVPDTISLEEVISLALQGNPELQVLKTEIKAKEARTFQESLLPNPELEIEFENFAGSGLLSGFKGMETTIGIGQLIELGGKRGKRINVAVLQSDLALLQYEIKRLDIITHVRKVFTQVLAAQKKINLDHQLLGLSKIFKDNVDTLVQAGRLSGAEAARAQVELSNRDIALKRSERELSNVRRKLSVTWGSSEAGFTAVKGDLTSVKKIPTVDILTQTLKQSPMLMEQIAIIKKQKAETKLTEAQAIPDPLISAGYRRFNDTDDQAFVAGLSIPIPLFDRNQGGQQEAQYRELRSEQHLQSLQKQISTEINNRLETIYSIDSEIETLQNVIIPHAQKAYSIFQKNYQMGKYGLIDVLDAQRQLFDAEGRYLDVLVEINLQVIELEQLVGQSLESL